MQSVTLVSGEDYQVFGIFCAETGAQVAESTDLYPKYNTGEWHSDDQKGHTVKETTGIDFPSWRKAFYKKMMSIESEYKRMPFGIVRK